MRISLFLLSGALALPAFAQQASLTFLDSGANICYARNTDWALGKTNDKNGAANDGDQVTWTVTVTKGSVSDSTICVAGFLSIKNTGSAPAPVGNIVVNLQKQAAVKGNSWVSAAADVADATNGDAATTGNILAAASQENPSLNASKGANNYVINGAKGTFAESPGKSGTLTFTDPASNDEFSLGSLAAIQPGQTLNMLFVAKFDNTNLNLPVGSPLRAEVIVSFANAGPRGGSGASGGNIDINGNGSVDGNEAWIRSVPTRLSMTLPALQDCNGTVTISDVIALGGGTTYDAGQNDLSAPVQVTGSGTFTVVAIVHNAGTITNTAYLSGTGSTITVNGSLIDPVTLLPVNSFTFPCCTAADLMAPSTVIVGAAPGFKDGDFCTYTVEEYKTSTKDGYQLITNHFADALGGLFRIGNLTPGNYNSAWTNAAKLQTYMGSGGGSAGQLTANTSNATSVAGGALTKELAAFSLNIKFSNGGGYGPPDGFGNLQICNTGTDFDGKTLLQVLGAANDYSGTVTGLPPGFATAHDLEHFLQSLNSSFTHGNPAGCKVSAFAQANLCRP